METGMILHLTASSDDQKSFTRRKRETLAAPWFLIRKGEELWRIESSELRALSPPSGNFFMVQDGAGNIVAYNHLLEEMWRKEWGGPNPAEIFINFPGDRMLIFDKQSDRKSNLYCFNTQGKLLWENFIDANALITFSSDGRYLIYSAGVLENKINQPKEGFSKIVLMNEKGDTDREIELPVKVEKKSLHPHIMTYLLSEMTAAYIRSTSLAGTKAKSAKNNNV